MAAPRSSLVRQIGILAVKNYIILLLRHPTSTIYTALLLPVILTIYLGIGRNLNSPQNDFGFAEPRAVRPLRDALSAADSSRSTVVFVNNGNAGGDIERVISTLSDEVSAAGKNATTVTDPSELSFICRPSFRGTTPCYGAVIFHSSPDEGASGVWNYTLRGDVVLGSGYKVDDDDNDAQVYTLPLQRAVDSAIARADSTDSSSSPLDDVQEWAYTEETEEEREATVRRNYQKTFIDYLAVSFVLALIGISYHLPGHVATEREKGLSQLIDAMMSTRREWEPQVARMAANFYSFATIYFPGWLMAAVITRFMVWRETNIGIVIVFFVLAGFALTSQAILGASFFKKAQLSGVINSLVYALLGILAQALPDPGTGAVAVLSLLFTPCAFVFFIKSIARFEAEGRGMDMIKAPPSGASTLPGIVIWVFLIIQFLVYPLLAAFVERKIHGVGSESRRIYRGDGPQPQDAVSIDGLTKVYRPSLFRRIFSFISKPREPTVAVDGLSLTAKRGQILALLGANGSGKSTTLDAIAGISRFDRGGVSIDASGGIGIAPQKNVLWDELTVSEHVRIFNQLKSSGSGAAAGEDMLQLIDSIGLGSKKSAQSKTLSGGQKRKLQLGMMLTGGSAVCCVDEVSSGIDALSRRKIWDILLSERGRRMIILTTHFLDEADLLADNIAILSKGVLKAEGSSVALKDALGSGYRIHVLNAKDVRHPPEIDGVELQASSNTIVYTAASSALAADVIRSLEAARIAYRISSPNIENVFLNVAEEVKGEDLRPLPGAAARYSDDSGQITEKGMAQGRNSLGLQSGRQTGFFKQITVLVYKRVTLFKTNWIPFVVAFLVPIVAAAIMQLLINGKDASTCDPSDPDRAVDANMFDDVFDDVRLAAGPQSALEAPFTGIIGSLLGAGTSSVGDVTSASNLKDLIERERKTINPGGIWAGTDNGAPTVAYRADKFAVFTAMTVQNVLSVARTNISIATSYVPFDSAFDSSTGSTVQLAIYFSIVLSVAPAFFGLYPNVERRSNVRGLQYSSGVRSFPLWAAHVIFDYGIFVVALLVAAAILVASSSIWYAPGYLFPVFILYGLTSILLSYVFSLVLNSQVATFAAILAYNSVGFAIYLIAFLYILTFSPAPLSGRNILIGHYTIAAVFPVASVCRALLVGLNSFSLGCDDAAFYSYPGTLNAYGAPILYLSVQAILLFGILLYHDSGNKIPSFLERKKTAPQTEAERSHVEPEVADELVRVETTGADDGLQVKHLTKKFGKFTAVDDVTFGVRHGEVFALLGPNGAGKSTTISLIRGDMQPSRGSGGDVLVEQVSVAQQRALARANLGVCPQFDAVDSMTVLEHLRHYARLRGIADAGYQVRAVVKAVGLEAHVHTMAQHLSGGNKRKLSLGIALTGNPSVILLDEPSSGLDAAAKRVMWRTLSTIVPGRSILLTTHSMEEADALASRAGIVARRMLAVGEVGDLRARFGDSLYVHLVSRSAPHSTPEEMQRVREWAQLMFPSAEVESETYHGQMRFSVPAAEVLARAGEMSRTRSRRNGGGSSDGGVEGLSAIGQLILMLEENKEALGIEHHSVSPTTLNDVFLAIVGRHNVQEEGYTAGGNGAAAAEKTKIPWRKYLLGF